MGKGTCGGQHGEGCCPYEGHMGRGTCGIPEATLDGSQRNSVDMLQMVQAIDTVKMVHMVDTADTFQVGSQKRLHNDARVTPISILQF